MIPESIKDKKTCSIELYTRAVEQVVDTWAILTKIPDYELVVGRALFEEIFNIAPQAILLYHFGEGFQPSNCSVPDEIYNLPTFRAHITAVICTLEMALFTLNGENPADLAGPLSDLGARHVSYGVHPAHYSIVETALLRALKGALGEVWTNEVQRGWAAVIKFILKGMQAGAGERVEIIKSRRRDLERTKSATLRLMLMKSSARTTLLSRKDSRRRFENGERSARQRNPPRKPTRRNDTVGVRGISLLENGMQVNGVGPADPMRSEEDSFVEGLSRPPQIFVS